MNDAYDDDAVGWDSLVGYPDPNVTIPVSYEAFVEEWNSEMVYVFDRQGDVATITQTCSVVKNLVEYDVVVGDRLVVEPKLGRGIDRYRSYRLLYDSVGRRRSGFHGSGGAITKWGPRCRVSRFVYRSAFCSSLPQPGFRFRTGETADYQRTGSLPCPARYSLAFEKCRQPKKPLLAEKGEGCGHLSMRLRVGSTIAPLRCA